MTREEQFAKLRIRLYSTLGVCLTLSAGAIQIAGAIDKAGLPLLRTFGSLAAAWVLLFIVDVAYHDLKGRGQACPQCGCLRSVVSFRISPACSNCGK